MTDSQRDDWHRTVASPCRAVLLLSPRSGNLRGIALGVCEHLPIDRDDALKVLELVRALVEWRQTGVHGLSPQAAEADARSRAGPAGGDRGLQPVALPGAQRDTWGDAGRRAVSR
ncbi:MAG TPA: hypothetical protein VKC66_26960 [Xanthobacteraceae bacterium]|nr:hypothetical protein [Xanthobacteraceae bacterium]